MNEIEKQIEEMARVINNPMLNYCRELAKYREVCQYSGKSCKQYTCRDYAYAERLHNAGYRNCKDKVVLTREEYEKIKQYEKKVRSGVCFTQKEWFDYINEDSNHTTSLLAQARKETTREILKNITSVMHDNRQYGSNFVVIYDSDIQEIAKEYGVEIKE